MAQPAARGHEPSKSLRYDPTVAYILEFSTLLAIRDDDTIMRVGKQVFDATQSILRDCKEWHAITVSRAAFYALRILKSSYVSIPDLNCRHLMANSIY